MITKVVISIIILIIGIALYYFLYKARSIAISFRSYIFFLINYMILIIYGISFIMLIQGKASSIYIEDLPQYSQYKYLFFVSFTIIGALILIFAKYVDILQRFITIVTFPYLKENIRLILYTWNETFFGHIWSFLITKLSQSLLYRIIYFVTHFIMTYVIPFILNILFIMFVFFHYDLCYLLYMIPITFFCWIFSLLDYYFQEFLIGSANYIRLLLNVNLKNNNSALYSEPYLITVNPNDLIFALTKDAFERGFTKDDLLNLSTEWLLQAKVNYIFSKYKIPTSYFSRINFILRFICWLSVCFYFFNPLENTLQISGGWETVASCFTRNSPFKTSIITRMPLEAFRIKPQHGKALEALTKGDYQYPHPVITDLKEESNGEVPLKAQPTHGSGPVTNPSVPLHDTQDFYGPHPKGQRMVVPKEKQTFNIFWLGKPIPNSQQYFETGNAKTNMAKYTYTEEENT